MGEFTKGEWEVTERRPGGNIVIKCGRLQVAEVMNYACLSEEPDKATSQAEANARLIAAAPKLFGQLIHTKTILAMSRPTECLCDPTNVHKCQRCAVDNELDSIEAVIADAETTQDCINADEEINRVKGNAAYGGMSGIIG